MILALAPLLGVPLGIAAAGAGVAVVAWGQLLLIGLLLPRLRDPATTAVAVAASPVTLLLAGRLQGEPVGDLLLLVALWAAGAGVAARGRHPAAATVLAVSVLAGVVSLPLLTTGRLIDSLRPPAALPAAWTPWLFFAGLNFLRIRQRPR